MKMSIDTEEPYALSTTIRLMRRYQRWRMGELDQWSEKDRTPPPKLVTKIIDSAIKHMKTFHYL